MVNLDMNKMPETVSFAKHWEDKHQRSPPTLLAWCSYTLDFAAGRDGVLPTFPGSAIRGAFGHALKRLVCVMRNRPCEGCPLEFTCLYTTIFETRPAPSGLAAVRNNRPPHPFVLKVSFITQRHLRKGEQLQVGVNLFGNAIAAYPFVLRALEEAGEQGLGANRLPFRLLGIRPANNRHQNQAPDTDYPAPIMQGIPQVSGSECSWRISTPLRLRSGGKPVDHRKLVPGDIAMPILRRLLLLVEHYGDPNQFPMLPDMSRKAGMLRFTCCSLHWKRLQRYSSRQSTTHSVSGLMGVVGLEFTDVPEWGPILAWAPVIHVGKATSMGLGRVDTI